MWIDVLTNSEISKEKIKKLNQLYLDDPEFFKTCIKESYIKVCLKEVPRDSNYWKNKLLKNIINDNYNIKKAYKNVYDQMFYEYLNSNSYMDKPSNKIHCNEKQILEEAYNKLIGSPALIEYCNKKYNEPVINNQLYYIGIYSLYCIKSKYTYIGQSIDIINRWRGHKSDLKHNRHINKKLQEDWNKYGEDNFTFNILEEVNCNIQNYSKSGDAANILSFREKHWINKIKRNYNVANPMNQTAYINNIIGDDLDFNDYSDAEDIIKTILSKLPTGKRNSFKKCARIILQY